MIINYSQILSIINQKELFELLETKTKEGKIIWEKYNSVCYRTLIGEIDYAAVCPHSGIRSYHMSFGYSVYQYKIWDGDFKSNFNSESLFKTIRRIVDQHALNNKIIASIQTLKDL